MKKITSVLFIIGMGVSVSAQTTSPPSTTQVPVTTTDTVPGNRGNNGTDTSFYRTNPDNPDSTIYNNKNKNGDANNSTDNRNSSVDNPAANQSPAQTNQEQNTQEDAIVAEKSTTEKSKEKVTEDRVFMKNNKIFVVKNGKTTPLSKSMKLNDGSTIMANGTLKMPDGSSMKLKNGERININTTKNKN